MGRVNPRWWLYGVAGLVLLDYFTGPLAPLPVLYAVPVTLAAWYSGEGIGLWLALVLPASRFAFERWVWNPAPPSEQEGSLTALMQISTFTILALLTFRLSEHERALKRDLKALQGLLPLCAYCKSIKNADAQWESLETYLQSRSGAEFSHGICSDCLKRLAPEH